MPIIDWYAYVCMCLLHVTYVLIIEVVFCCSPHIVLGWWSSMGVWIPMSLPMQEKVHSSHITFFLSLTSFPYDAFRQMNHQVHAGFNMYAM